MTFLKFYNNRNDYELILVEDYKNYLDDQEHNNLKLLLSSITNIKIVHIIQNIKTFNPCIAFNLGVKASSGDYIILTNPECCHENDIFAKLDTMNLDDNYIVCACKNTSYWSIDKIDDNFKLNFTVAEWYQHSIMNNRRLHFCSIISKLNYNKVGGFDEEYAKGIAYEDDDFRNIIIKNNIPIISTDEAICIHLNHPSISTIDNANELVNLNMNYYKNKWGV